MRTPSPAVLYNDLQGIPTTSQFLGSYSRGRRNPTWAREALQVSNGGCHITCGNGEFQYFEDLKAMYILCSPVRGLVHPMVQRLCADFFLHRNLKRNIVVNGT